MKKFYTVLFLLLAVTMTACGGGSSSSSPNEQPPNQTPNPEPEPAPEPEPQPEPEPEPEPDFVVLNSDGTSLVNTITLEQGQEFEMQFALRTDTELVLLEPDQIQVTTSSSLAYHDGTIVAEGLGQVELRVAHSNYAPILMTIMVVPGAESKWQTLVGPIYNEQEGETLKETPIHLAKYAGNNHFIYQREYRLDGEDKSALYAVTLQSSATSLSFGEPKLLVENTAQWQLDNRFLGLGKGRYIDWYDGIHESRYFFFFGRNEEDPSLKPYVYDFSTGELSEALTPMSARLGDDGVHHLYDGEKLLFIFRWAGFSDPEKKKVLRFAVYDLEDKVLVTKAEPAVEIDLLYEVDEETVYLANAGDMIIIPKEIAPLGYPAKHFRLSTIRANKNNLGNAGVEDQGLEHRTMELALSRLQTDIAALQEKLLIHKLSMTNELQWDMLTSIQVLGRHAFDLSHIESESWRDLLAPPYQTASLVGTQPSDTVVDPEHAGVYIDRDNKVSYAFVEGQVHDADTLDRSLDVWISNYSDEENNAWKKINLYTETNNSLANLSLHSLGAKKLNYSLKSGDKGTPYLLSHKGVWTLNTEGQWINPKNWQLDEDKRASYISTDNAFILWQNNNSLSLQYFQFRK